MDKAPHQTPPADDDSLSLSLATHLLARRTASSMTNGTPDSTSPSTRSPRVASRGSISSSSSPGSFSPIHPEPDRKGNLEYKLRILPVSAARFSRLVTQLKWRLAEGGGLAVYEIGVLDDGTLVGLPREEMRSSLAQLALMGRALGATCEVRRCIVVERATGPNNDATAESPSDPTPQSSLGAANAMEDSSLSQTLNYRHRLGSVKGTSAGLDNIVGLQPLDNKQAAEVLGHAVLTGRGEEVPNGSWTFDIASASDSDETQSTFLGEESDDNTEAAVEGASSEDEGDEDGFAFSLSLSDEEALPPKPATSAKKKKAATLETIRRPSRSVNNSPWSRFDRSPASPADGAVVRPNLLPSSGEMPSMYAPSNATEDASAASSSPHDHGEGLLHSSTQGYLSNDVNDMPTELGHRDRQHVPSVSGLRSTPPGSPSEADFKQRPRPVASDLNGIDVGGTLHFSLDRAVDSPNRDLNPLRSSRDNLTAMDHEQSGPPCSGAATNGFSQEPWEDGLLPWDELSSTSAMKGPRPNRGPRIERRARRLAEHKAREREGQGLLIALELEPQESEERRSWWKFSSLNFEEDVPFYDPGRHSWMREISDWLTVEEVMDLADTWRPGGAKREEQLEHSNEDSGSGILDTAAAQEIAASTKHPTGSPVPTSGSKERDHLASRKAELRRRRREQRKREAVAAAVEAANQWTATSLSAAPGKRSVSTDVRETCSKKASPRIYATRPSYLPPPSNGLPIQGRHSEAMGALGPKAAAMKSGTAYVSSAAVADPALQTDPSVTLNIEAPCQSPGTRNDKREATPSESICASISPSSSEAPTITDADGVRQVAETSLESLNLGPAGAPSDSVAGSAESESTPPDPPALRLIVEAVLSLPGPLR
ncbi:unnamed protein product [Parajaminaea phylloscopi]